MPLTEVVCAFTRHGMRALNSAGLPEKRAVRAKTCQFEGVGIGFAIDQQQVWPDMAFAVTCPITAQVVIAVFGIQGLIQHQLFMRNGRLE